MMPEGFEAGSSFVVLGVDLTGLTKGFLQGKRETEKFASGVEKRVSTTSRAFTKLGSAAGAFGKVLGGAAIGTAVLGIGALGKAIVSGVGDAREAKQVFAATENVIRSMGRTGQVSADQIADMASSLSAAEGKSLFGDDEIQAGQNMLLTFANINEVLPDATQAMVDMTQFMGGDMVGASTMLGKALDNPTQGLSALTRVGVSFSDQQKEQIKVMQEAGDMAGAQGVILDALKSQFGGAALAAAQADGGWAQFRDRMGEIAEGVGGSLLPILNRIPEALNSPDVMAAITGFATGLATGVGGAISWLTTTGVPLLVTGISGIATAINTWVITPAKDAVTAFNDWKAFGTEWGIVAALQAIGDKFPVIQPLTDWLQNIAPGAIQGVREAFGLARDSFITFRDALAGEWTPNTEAIHPLHEAIGEFGLMIRNEALPALKNLYNSLITEAPIAWATFKTSIDTDVIPVLQRIVAELNKQSNEDVPKAAYSWEEFGIRLAQVLNSSQAVASGWGADIRSIFSGVTSDISNRWTEAVNRLIREWTNFRINTYNEFQTINTILVNAVGAVERWVGNVVSTVAGLPGKIRGAIGDMSMVLFNASVSAIVGLIGGIQSKIPSLTSILSGITKLIPKFKGPIEKERKLLYPTGQAIIGGLINGMTDSTDSLKSALGKTIIGAIQVAAMNASPFAGTIGGDLGGTMAQGVGKGLKTTLGQTIPGAVADVSKSLMSDKNRSDEAKSGKGSGGHKGIGDLGALIAQGSGILGGVAEYAGSQGEMTALSFVERYQQSLIDLQPQAVVKITDWFQVLRRDGSGPALVALEDQMYLGGLAGITSLGNGLTHDLSSIEAAGREAGAAYMSGFNSAVGPGGGAAGGGTGSGGNGNTITIYTRDSDRAVRQLRQLGY